MSEKFINSVAKPGSAPQWFHHFVNCIYHIYKSHQNLYFSALADESIRTDAANLLLMTRGPGGSRSGFGLLGRFFRTCRQSRRDSLLCVISGLGDSWLDFGFWAASLKYAARLAQIVHFP
jgi:hypothetical protein